MTIKDTQNNVNIFDFQSNVDESIDQWVITTTETNKTTMINIFCNKQKKRKKLIT